MSGGRWVGVGGMGLLAVSVTVSGTNTGCPQPLWSCSSVDLSVLEAVTSAGEQSSGHLVLLCCRSR